MKFFASILFSLLFSLMLSAQGYHTSAITGVSTTEDGGVLIKLTLFDPMGTQAPNDDKAISSSHVFVAPDMLPSGSEKTMYRFRKGMPSVYKLSDREHLYVVHVYYENGTTDPTDDVILGEATFKLDAKRSQKILDFHQWNALKVRPTADGAPAYEEKQVEVEKLD